MRRKLSGSAFTENRISLHGSRLAVMTSTVLCCKSVFCTLKKTCSLFEVANTLFLFRGYKQVELDFLVETEFFSVEEYSGLCDGRNFQKGALRNESLIQTQRTKRKHFLLNAPYSVNYKTLRQFCGEFKRCQSVQCQR